jgi:hypothetical protein
MTDKRVKIIKDTVSHRIPIGKVVKIKGDALKTIRGKKCYNVLDYSSYISEDDFQILPDEVNLINEDFVTPSSPEPKKDWFEQYAEQHNDSTIVKKPKRGDKVYARNVTALTPNGTQSKAPDGKYIIYEEKNGRFWLRRDDKNDLNEYFCSAEKITTNR